MVSESAPETEGVLVAAMNGRDNLIELRSLYTAFDGEFTVWTWAPDQIVFVVNVSSIKKNLESGIAD
jgi:hypothetical protein